MAELTLVASSTVSAVRWASRATAMRLKMTGMLSATTPSRGTSTSRASLPRMRNLPKSTGSLPPCRIDLAVRRRHLVEVVVVAALGLGLAHGHAASAVPVGTRGTDAATTPGQRQDQGDQDEQHQG